MNCLQASQSSASHQTIYLLIAQRISIALHRENALAIMKRMALPIDEDVDRQSGWASHVHILED